MNFNALMIAILCAAMTLIPAGASEDDHHDNEEIPHTRLTDAAIANANLTLDTVGKRSIDVKHTLFGVIAANNDNIVHVGAKYQGVVTQLLANVGDTVKQGQTLAVIENISTGASFNVTSPLNGEVTARSTNRGEVVAQQPFFEILDVSSVWVELSAFPENIEVMKEQQTAYVYDLHHHQRVTGKVAYIAPQMTGGHIARARIEIANSAGHWRPGMHVKADVITDSFAANVAVHSDAIQRLEEQPVVFLRDGNRFEARVIKLGRTDGRYVEVLDGLKGGESYVVENSYLIKADILKQGAGHSH
ncbi:Cobalt-zinc-cadmium resistance protein CzcB [Pseudidiomarina piscicola]|uniref:Cobalt-zinc-cadmium resistance protein CzcB n=1 Tax=Pseudidiomarina piscicola TaxID=2614830 RepID=A0A6S6WKA2_9GAMM|nr:efflux RND transporter periplasmic adaptor subunit [Pseudidiomarina piscicola]CAB0150131.1 Cobalt-zinc-cadmium resistance protein CzcB [Pseudidiomarina piscicola]VZT39571.1 Cobalt-zinc-cadmium resistance protein CzcB [Pseudomonas aeruginosa]